MCAVQSPLSGAPKQAGGVCVHASKHHSKQPPRAASTGETSHQMMKGRRPELPCNTRSTAACCSSFRCLFFQAIT